MKEHFSDYTEQVVKLMVPMLKFYFHDGVRTAAAESLPFLLECAKIKGPAYLQEMWGFMLPELLKVSQHSCFTQRYLYDLFYQKGHIGVGEGGIPGFKRRGGKESKFSLKIEKTFC